MWELILSQWQELPAYIPTLIEKFLIPVIIVAVVYLIALFFSNHFAYVLRWFYILACIALLIFGYFRGNYSLMWLVGFSLVFMLLFKIIVGIAKYIKGRRRDRKIERVALAKAEQRRGSFANKQAYSGAPKPITDEPYVPEKMNDAEINDVIRNEVSGNTENLTEILDQINVPRDPLAEISETKSELTEAIETAKFDVDAIEAALAESKKQA